MKRLLAILLSITIIFCLPGCKSNDDAATNNTTTAATNPVVREGKVVGISMPDDSWQNIARSMQAQLEALGYQTMLTYANSDPENQINQLITMSASVDCIIVTAADPFSLVETVEEIAANGISIIAYDCLITDTDAVSYYLSPDYKSMGVEVGEYIISSLSLDTAKQEEKSYTFELFMGNPADMNSVLFYDGILQTLQDYINDKVLVNLSKRLDFEDVCVADGTAGTADSLCSGRISNYYRQTPLDICIAGTDTIAQGIMESLKYYGYDKNNWPMITGMGYSDATMFNGELLLSVYTPTEKIVKACASLVDAAIFDNPPDVREEMTTRFNNTAYIPTCLCGYMYAEKTASAPQKETPSFEVENDPSAETEDHDFHTEDTRPDDNGYGEHDPDGPLPD